MEVKEGDKVRLKVRGTADSMYLKYDNKVVTISDFSYNSDTGKCYGFGIKEDDTLFYYMDEIVQIGICLGGE